MREIKFRAWDKEDQQMRLVVRMTGDAYAVNLHDVHGYPYWQDRETFELMQYTGLKDKNGVEIYEGDIVEFLVSSGELVRQQVIFNRGAFITKSGRMWGFEKESNYLELYEVIGNIYEPPPEATEST